MDEADDDPGVPPLWWGEVGIVHGPVDAAGVPARAVVVVPADADNRDRVVACVEVWCGHRWRGGPGPAPELPEVLALCRPAYVHLLALGMSDDAFPPGYEPLEGCDECAARG